MKLSGPSRMLTPYATSDRLTLPRRCAQAVARYRVLNNVPLKNIRIRLYAPGTHMTAASGDAAASASTAKVAL